MRLCGSKLTLLFVEIEYTQLSFSKEAKQLAVLCHMLTSHPPLRALPGKIHFPRHGMAHSEWSDPLTERLSPTRGQRPAWVRKGLLQA